MAEALTARDPSHRSVITTNAFSPKRTHRPGRNRACRSLHPLPIERTGQGGRAVVGRGHRGKKSERQMNWHGGAAHGFTGSSCQNNGIIIKSLEKFETHQIRAILAAGSRTGPRARANPPYAGRRSEPGSETSNAVLVAIVGLQDRWRSSRNLHREAISAAERPKSC